jgi:hypothetical protein
VLALASCLLVFGLIPGSVLRPTLFERLAPPLAPSNDQDADLDVTVVARDTHLAVARARVQAIAMIDAHAHLAGSIETDRAGHASLHFLPHGEVWLLADAPGFARVSSQLLLAAGGRTVKLELMAEHRLAVSVADDRGAPIEGAEVLATSLDPLPIGAHTGKDGVAHLARLPDAPWIVTASCPGFEQVSRRGVRDGDSVAITLRKLGAMVVTVLGADDAPAAAAHVQIAGASLWPARVADTGEEGRVRIAALEAGSYALRAVQGEYASPIELGVLLERGEEKSLTLRLLPGRIVAVRVTDGEAKDASPIAGARVSVAEAGVSPFPFEASTDRDGRARLGPIAAGAAFVSARADGFVARSGVEVPDAGQVVAVALVRAGMFKGRVLDPRGFPVDGATVEIVGTDALGAPIDDDPRRSRFREAHFDATLAGPRPLIQSGELGVVPGPVPPIPHTFDAPLPPVGMAATLEEPWVTRDDGTFRAFPVTPGRVRALVRHPQFVEQLSDPVTLVGAGEAYVEIVMHAGGGLEGRVVDASDRSVAGARVTVAASRGSLERTTRTAADGSFAFAALPSQVTLSASRDDDAAQAAARMTLEVPEGGRREVTLVLPDPRPPLAARVRDDRGYPVETAQVTVSSIDPTAPLRATAFTDARGEASIPGAHGLALRVEVHAPRHASAVLTADPSLDLLEVTLAPAERCSAQVRTLRGGEPIADAEVTLYTDGGVRRTRTDRSGGFSIEDLPAGALHLRVRASGFATIMRDLSIASTSEHSTDLGRIELAPEAVVTGTVVDGRGDPVPHARVAKDRVPTYLAVGVAPSGIAVADDRGRFRVGELGEGTIALEAYAPDVGRARVEGIRTSFGRTTDGIKITLRSASDERNTEPAAAGSVAVTLGEVSGDPREVVLVAVADSSEAERTGLAPGDTLLEVDGVPVHSIAEARSRLSGPLGDDVLVKLRRGDRVESLRVPREPVRR